jgi:endo-1,4-beta-xylanase
LSLRRLAVVAVGCAVLVAAAPAAAGPPEAGPGLRAAADVADFNLGAAVRTDWIDDRPFRRLVRREVNTVTFENEAKWQIVHPSRGRYSFGRADRIASFAERNGLVVRGHVLLWHVENPAWLTRLELTREQALQLLRDHIETVVGHFRRKFPRLVVHWDVVNEPTDSDGSRRNTIWQRAIGDDYIERAFRIADRVAGPRTKLFLNEYFDAGMVAGSEFLTGGHFDDGDAIPFAFPGALGALPCELVVKCVATRELVAGLLARGVPIDGVGFQGHIPNPLPSDYRGLTAWVGDLGLEWAITEMDVPVPKGTSTNPLVADHQLRAYTGALGACIDDPACDTLVMWGLSDRYTWWDTLVGGILTEPLPFDRDLQPKPAAYAMEGTLRGASAK